MSTVKTRTFKALSLKKRVSGFSTLCLRPNPRLSTRTSDTHRTSDCVISIFKILPSHYSTLFDYKLGLLSHFLSVFYLFLPLFRPLIRLFDFLHSLTLYAIGFGMALNNKNKYGTVIVYGA